MAIFFFNSATSNGYFFKNYKNRPTADRLVALHQFTQGVGSEYNFWKQTLVLGSSPPSSKFYLCQSSKSGRAFWVGFGPKVDKNFLIRAWDILIILGAQKYNQNNSATLLNFLDLT